ncbi:unnamed protein product [Pleuronectes platessa]|uniref:C-type lectin domain-containing protein n=1 Tax=Pleuronectes platessa TaxID=8262 RepID=A0A9N7U8M8_PLEPL|nr:unnamed protein product [Pleuronectes platessa]
MEQLSGGDAWIGLNRRGNVNTWKWSDGSSSTFRLNSVNKASGGKCVSTQSGEWSSAPCDDRKPFFCYKDKMKLIKQEKTWEEALDFCREKHDDLVSITDQKQQEWVKEEVGQAGTDFIWLGLRYTCTLNIWFWVNGESCFTETSRQHREKKPPTSNTQHCNLPDRSTNSSRLKQSVVQRSEDAVESVSAHSDGSGVFRHVC